MRKFKFSFLFILVSVFYLNAQDLTEGLLVNDLALHPMQPLAKPPYLGTAIDPSFGTTIRRISNAPIGGVVVPMYSTIQAWNADESLMILYDQTISDHQLLDGMNYEYIRHLTDVSPADLEQIFWDFNDPDVFYYPEAGSNDFIKYTVSTGGKQILVNLASVSNCTSGISMGNDVQMMSWDSDVLTFRCGNTDVYSYRISTATLTNINVQNVNWVAPMPGPSGNLFHHRAGVYDSNGSLNLSLNSYGGEHSCLGKTASGDDAYLAIAFAQGPNGGCIGDIIAHNLSTGVCTDIISQALGYDYPQSGTHLSAISHKNTEGGWMCASMMGYEQDGQDLLDQELVIARIDEGNPIVCRIGHHRSDEDDYDYWGEPHAVMSPTGTRVLYGSDWSGAEDGQSVDSYVIELPAFSTSTTHIEALSDCIEIFPNPVTDKVIVKGNLSVYDVKIFNEVGQIVTNYSNAPSPLSIDLTNYGSGMYFISMQHSSYSDLSIYKIIKE